MSRVLSKLRADWRRGRALKQLKLGKRQFWEWESNTEAGTICGDMLFKADDDVLILVFFSIYAKDVEEKGEYQAPLGLEGVRAFLDLCARLGAEAGFARMRVAGQRTKRSHKRGGRQRFEFDLAQYLRGSRPAR
jgi:hypothetical protein